MGVNRSKQLAREFGKHIKSNDVQGIREITALMQKENVSVDTPIGQYGEPPMVVAIQGWVDENTVKKETVQAVLDAGCDVNLECQYAWSYTPLYAAVRANHQEAVRFLIANNADVNKHVRTTDIPLILCAGMGYKDMARILLESGANPNIQIPRTGGTSFMFAVHSSHVHAMDIINMLIEHGGDPSKVNNQDKSVLHSAGEALVDVTVCLDKLFEYELDVNLQDQFGYSPLHLCALTNKQLTGKYLLNKGANPLLLEKDGKTAQAIAIQMKHPDMAEIMREAEESWVAEHGDPTGAQNQTYPPQPIAQQAVHTAITA